MIYLDGLPIDRKVVWLVIGFANGPGEYGDYGQTIFDLLMAGF